MSWLSNMRGPRLKTPLLLLLLLLLLLSSLTAKAFSQDEGEEAIIKSTEEPQETEPPTPTPDENQDGGTTQTSPTSTSSQTEAVEDDTGSGSGNPAGVGYVNSTDLGQEEKGLDLLLLLIPAILAVVLIVAIVCGAVIIKRQCNKNSTSQEESKEDPYLDGSSTEKVPMPMFEEDVPSVLELEMDELDKWMQKDF